MDFSIFKSKKMTILHEKLNKVSKCDFNVMLLGETGVGKTEAASWIHDHSSRKNKKFHSINIGTMSKELLLSSLCGVTKGAFTDCQESKPGIFEKCDGGTLFIDEIGEIDIETQTSFLAMFTANPNELKFSRMGSDEEKRVNIRIITATDKSIVDLVKNGAFKKTFLNRITAFDVYFPSLRDRKEDIKTLINYYCDVFRQFKNIKITAEAVAVMEEQKWTGNIRELFACLDVSLSFKKQEQLKYPTLCVKDLHFTDYVSPEETEKKSVLSVDTPANFLNEFSEIKTKISDLKQNSEDPKTELIKNQFTTCLKRIPVKLTPALAFKNEYTTYSDRVLCGERKADLSKQIGISLPTFRKRLKLVNELNTFINTKFQ
jgi:DNA-binding NtrC family response regulator